ncbi:hypothetical protein L596_021323 [Steinernema carpocapsae]|uniref:ShKT domain-containing protein n=1 Tax=Steinernema carpocapsae TaxID=34508 RepID=A0A4U5MIE7_STECR|nr:hypothetical protein L596_021323 [Steinernema carpocapsae]
MVTEAQQPFCLRRTPTGGCVCDKDTPCPDTKTKSLKCDLEKEVCVTSFDETNTFHPCTDGLCPLDNQFCYHGWCVFVPFIVTTSKPTFVFTKPTFVFTTPKPVTRPRKPTWFPRPMRPCVDWVKPGHSHSDCPARRHLCDNSLYYDVMTQECPRTCNRCYDNYGLPCPYRPPYYPYPGNREPFYPGNRQPFYPGRPGGWERRPADRWIPSIYNPCNGLPGGR